MTDVEDASFKDQRPAIELASLKKNYLTIVGIGSSFRSDICEEMVNVPGYNYFCAV